MMFGLGTALTGGTVNTATSVPLPGFTDGLKLWTSPGTALTVASAAASNPSAAFGSAALPFTAGVFAVPIGILALILTMKGRR